jgi:hypothetical protein
MAELSADSGVKCIPCGWSPSRAWLAHLTWVANHGVPAGHRIACIILKCPECDRMIHHKFEPVRLTDAA